MATGSNERLYVELLRNNFEKILSELDLVYRLTHSGEKGREAEEILKNFLKNYLPKKYEVTTGFVHTDMGTSNQSDILLYDANNYSSLYSGYVNQIIPMASLKAVIECTMSLDTNKVEDDNKKVSNLKALYRDDSIIINSMSREPLAVLFAYKSKGDILKKLNSLKEKNFDIVFCADGKLYILNHDNGEYTNNLVDNINSGETEHGYTFTKQQRAFALFYSHLIDSINGITSEPNKYKMVSEYSRSVVHVDYNSHT